MKLGYKIIIGVVSFILIFLLVCNVIPPKKSVEENPFITGETMLCAHRGGKINFPENTLLAYQESVRLYDVEILETDLYLTKDNYLVLNHDEYINRTCDVEEVLGSPDKYYIRDHTLDELKQFNFGYKFTKNNETPYKELVSLTDDIEYRKQVIAENRLSIVTLNDLFEAFYEDRPDMLFIVEIKDEAERGYFAADLIADILEQYPLYKNRIVVGTFHDEIGEYLEKEHPSIMRGASWGAAKKYVITQMFKVNIFENQTFGCLQLPEEALGFNLTKKTYIRRAHRRNIAVQYWTINDEDTMRMLIEKGCDAIMTDDPELLRKVLNDYNK